MIEPITLTIRAPAIEGSIITSTTMPIILVKA